MCRKNLSLIQSIIMTSLHTRIFFKFVIIGSALLAMVLSSCIDDSISGSPAHQPSFSVDTLHMGTVFTDQVTTTYRMTVYNRNSEGIAINDIHLEGPNASLFRLNVDGMSGTRFSDVEIRAKDSIYVLVESTLPENGVDLPVDINADLYAGSEGFELTPGKEYSFTKEMGNSFYLIPDAGIKYSLAIEYIDEEGERDIYTYPEDGDWASLDDFVKAGGRYAILIDTSSGTPYPFKATLVADWEDKVDIDNDFN